MYNLLTWGFANRPNMRHERKIGHVMSLPGQYPRLQEGAAVCTWRAGTTRAFGTRSPGCLKECNGLVTYVVHNESYESWYGSGGRRR